MAEPLLGVILATSSSRGSHIVFRWPNNPKLFKRYSKVKYYTDARPSNLNRAQLDEDLDPVRQKAKWDRHDEDEDDNAEGGNDSVGQSDTPSSSDVEDSDGSVLDEDENRSVRDRADTIISHGRSKTGAASTNRSKSKARRPLAGLEESTQSVRSNDRQTGTHKDAGADTHDRAPDSDAGTSRELSPEEKARQEEKAARAYKTYLGYDVEILASILNPRPELAHQKFELVVDDLAFLGHPVSAGRGGTWGSPEDKERSDEDGDDERDRSTQQRGRSGLRKEIRPYDVPDGEDLQNKPDTRSSTASRSISRPRTEHTTDSSSTSRSYAPSLNSISFLSWIDRTLRPPCPAWTSPPGSNSSTITLSSR